MKRGRGIRVAPALAPLAAMLAAMLLASGSAGAAEENRPTDFQPPQEREFKSSYDGTMQKYVVLLPRQFDAGKHDLLLPFHGHGSDRQQYITQPRGECAGARDVASRRKMVLVSPDYRGNSWMGPAAEADMVQLIAELKKTYKVRKVFIVGASMGGTAVLTFAAIHPDLVDGVSSQNGVANLLEYNAKVSNIQDAIKDSYGGRKDESPEDYKKRNPAEYQKRSAELHPQKFTMPLAITVGLKDTVVPPPSTLRLAEAVKKKNKNVLVIERPTGGHSTSFEDTVKALEFVIDAAARK